MIKFQALVYVVSIGLSWNVNAQQKRNEYAGGGDCGTKYTAEIGVNKTPEGVDKANSNFDRCMKLARGASSDSCEDAGPDLQKARSELSAACDTTSLGKGIQECLAKQKECSNFKAKSGSSSTEKAKDRAKYCPSVSEDDDRLQKQLDKAEEKLAAAKEKIPDLQEKVTSASSDANKSISELRQKGRDALTDMNKAIKETKRDKDKEIARIQEQMAQIAAQMGQADEQIGQIELSKTDAAMKRDETKTQIDLNCHQTASATVSKFQSDALAKMQGGVYSRGSQNSIMKNVGMSDRESWQKVAEKYYVWCLRSKPTVESKASANRMYTQAINQADKAIENAKKRKALLQAQLTRMKNPDGSCGSTAPAADGSTGESDMCRATRQTNEDLMSAQQEYAQKMQGLNEDVARERQDGSQKMQAAQQALMKASQSITDEQTRVNNLRSVLDARADSPQGSTSKEEKSELRKALSKWSAAASQYDSCCANNKAHGNLCGDNAADLSSMGGEPEYGKTKPDPEPAADTISGATTTGSSVQQTETRSQRNPPTNTNGGESSNTRTSGEGAR